MGPSRIGMTIWYIIKQRLFYSKLNIINCRNMRTTPNSPLSNFALAITTFRTFLRTYLWQKQHDVEFESSIICFWGICPHSGLGNLLCWVNHNQVIVPPTCQLSINTHLATSPSCNISLHFHWKCQYVYDKMGICSSTVLTIRGIP